MERGQIKVWGQIERLSDCDFYLDNLKKGIEESFNLDPFLPTKEITKQHGKLIPSERELVVRISHDYIGYLVTDFGYKEKEDNLYKLNSKGYIQLKEHSMKFEEVDESQLEKFTSMVN